MRNRSWVHFRETSWTLFSNFFFSSFFPLHICRHLISRSNIFVALRPRRPLGLLGSGRWFAIGGVKVYLFYFFIFLNSVFCCWEKTSASIHIIALYISMIRAEENYSHLTVVEEIIWRRERERDSYACTHTHTHTHTRTHARTHTLDRKEWCGCKSVINNTF